MEDEGRILVENQRLASSRAVRTIKKFKILKTVKVEK